MYHSDKYLPRHWLCGSGWEKERKGKELGNVVGDWILSTGIV